MPRFLPLVIIAVGVAAIAIDFAPLDRPFSDPAVKIDTRLGLDLQGGLRGEYRAPPAPGGLVLGGFPPARASSVVPGQPIPADLAVIFSGDKVKSAAPGFTDAGLRAVNLTLTDEGARLFDQYAAAHYGEQFAIVLDNIVESAPVIRATR